METSTLLEMQRAIAKGLSFFQWWANQTIYAQNAFYSKDICQIRYKEQEDLISIKSAPEQLIVTDRNGWPLKNDLFVLHTDAESASRIGQAQFGKGEFIIKKFSDFKKTRPYRLIKARIAIKNKWEKFKCRPS